MRDLRAEGFRPWPVPGRAYTADCYPPKGALLIVTHDEAYGEFVIDWDDAYVWAQAQKHTRWPLWWKLTGIAREEMGWPE